MQDSHPLKAAIIAYLAAEKAYNLPRLCVSLGLAVGEEREASQSKALYVRTRLDNLDEGQLRQLAGAILERRPDHRLQEALDLDRQGPTPGITELTRRQILDHLSLTQGLSGNLEIVEFLARVWPLSKMPSSDPRFSNADGDISQHMVWNDDWTLEYLFKYLGLLTCSDRLFARFLEALVHPVVRSGDQQQRLVTVLNGALAPDGVELYQNDELSGQPVFAVRHRAPGVKGRPKNLIFASVGPKPDIVLADAVNNDLRVVRNEQFCLIFDDLIPQSGLLWARLVEWWAGRNGHLSSLEAERSLYKRLAQSLASPPERHLFRTYYSTFRRLLGLRLPALVPQVYLHFDPLSRRQRHEVGPVPRQRMDFLLLLSAYDRIVIEVDGKQHYAEQDMASPSKYAEMVAADRDLELAGYRVFRFGAAELSPPTAVATVESFFTRLFRDRQLVG